MRNRLIATTGPFNRGIDTAHAKSKGIAVSGTWGAGNATLDHIWALILATTRHIVEEDTNIKAGKPQWQSIVPTSLAGKTLGLIGLGRLGSQVAQVRPRLSRRLGNQTIWSSDCEALQPPRPSLVPKPHTRTCSTRWRRILPN